MDAIKLTLYTRPQCHLCDVLKARVEALSDAFDLDLSEINVETDPMLETRFGDQVPVLLVNGRKAFKYEASEDALRQRLKRELQAR